MYQVNDNTRRGIFKSIAGFIGMGPQKGPSTGMAAYFQQQALSKQNISDLYGTADDFIAAYEGFEKEYFKAISNQNNIAYGKNVDVRLMQAQGKIDLSVLNKSKASELEAMFKKNVFKLQDLITRHGLPGVQLPNANMYRDSFRFRVGENNGVMHPAQILLNNTIFSHTSGKQGIESLSFGKGLMSSAQLRQLSSRDISDVFPSSAKKILTFDVETTGIFESSQVRSMSMSEMTIGRGGKRTITQVPGMNFAFDSPQLSGMTAQTNRGVSSMVDFLANVEFGEDAAALRSKGVLVSGPEGFLDAADKFINRLLQADAVAGHNIQFDLGKIVSTAQDMQGYESHALRGSITKLYERINQGDYLIDTLQSTRNFLIDQAELAVQNAGVNGLDAQTKKLVTSLYSEDVLAKVHIGGSASYASVENVALNTNLFELIEKDGQADNLYKLISKGSHIAETDVMLQAYMSDYIQKGELKIWANATDAKSSFGTFARNQIARSSAITPTTNIADVQHMSRTALDFARTEEGARRVSIKVSGGSVGLSTSADGILQYEAGKFKFFSGANDPEEVVSSKALAAIRGTIDEAVAGTLDQDVTVNGKVVGSVNAASQRIFSLGVSYGENSIIEELMTSKALNIADVNTVAGDDIINAYGSIYKNFGSTLSTADMVRIARGQDPIESPFNAGLGSYNSATAGAVSDAFAKAGDPFAFLDPRSRVFSTIMAAGTTGIGDTAMRAAVASGVDSKAVTFASNLTDLSEGGMSFFQAGKTARFFGDTSLALTGDVAQDVSSAGVSRVAVPYKVLKDVLGADDLGGLTLSQMPSDTDKVALNLVYNPSKTMKRDEALDLAQKLFDTFEDANKVAKIMGVAEADLDQTVKTTVARVGSLKNQPQQAVNALADMIMSNGIIIGSADVDRSVINQLAKTGFEFQNDATISGMVGRSTSTALGDDVITVAQFGNETALKATGQQAAFDQAAQAKVQYQAKAAEAIQESGVVARARIRRAKTGLGPNNLLEGFQKMKPKLGLAGAGLAVLGAGYYISKRHREKSLYDETMEIQPYENGRSINSYNDSAAQFVDLSSRRIDPLRTAGVVGNLDRSKIGHTYMGNNKYDHLYGR